MSSENWSNIWPTLTQTQKEAVLFRIRADLFIDQIPLALIDLEEIDNKSALELLENMLQIKSNGWKALIDSALEEYESLSKIANDLKIRVSIEKDLYVCKSCNFEGKKEDFMIIEETDELICPECEAEGDLIIKSQ